MIEQYVYNLITQDATLATLLDDGSGGFKLYPVVVPREEDVDQAIAFSTINSTDVYPEFKSVDIQFNIFAQTHTKVVEIANALANIFNEDNNKSEGGQDVVFSKRRSETDFGYDFDNKLYQREATYYFKLR